jgi:predicted metal-dependent HD superfamily phosphohydrolase
MDKYYENAEGQLFVDPILANHDGLTEITQEQFNQIIEERSKPTTNQLLRQLTQARKSQDRQGVTINGIRYAGDPGNRQTLQEAIAFMEDAGLTEFAIWKDSDGVFHQNNPLADVKDAARAIGARRSQLIAAEGEYAAQIIAGTLTDLTETEVVWP